MGTLQGWLLRLGPYPRRLCGHHCPGRGQALFQGFSKISQNIYLLTHLSPAATLSLDSLEPITGTCRDTQFPPPNSKLGTPTHVSRGQDSQYIGTQSPTPKCQATARRGQAGKGPAGPSLKEASRGAGPVGRLCQNGPMLPTGSWEGGREWPISGGPHPQPRTKNVPAEKVAGPGGPQAQMNWSNTPSPSRDGMKPRPEGQRDEEAKRARTPDMPAASLFLTLPHSLYLTLPNPASHLIPWELLTGRLAEATCSPRNQPEELGSPLVLWILS